MSKSDRLLWYCFDLNATPAVWFYFSCQKAAGLPENLKNVLHTHTTLAHKQEAPHGFKCRSNFFSLITILNFTASGNTDLELCFSYTSQSSLLIQKLYQVILGQFIHITMAKTWFLLKTYGNMRLYRQKIVLSERF